MTLIAEPPAADLPHRVADQYDHDYHYEPYWTERAYEDAAERVALRRMLHGRRFGAAADVGGGFGRLTGLLAQHADRTTLIEPSHTQLVVAERVLAGTGVSRQLGQADDLPFGDATLDLVMLIRVMHHLPDPTRELAEIARVLKPGATAIIEVANSGHALNRWRYHRLGAHIPTTPVDRSSTPDDDGSRIPFVNHDIATVTTQLAMVGLDLHASLSVSNLRSTRLKRLVPARVLVAAEWCTQRVLAPSRFGPSIFLELRRRG